MAFIVSLKRQLLTGCDFVLSHPFGSKSGFLTRFIFSCLLAVAFSPRLTIASTNVAYTLVSGIPFPAHNVHDDRDPTITYRGAWSRSRYPRRLQATQSYSNQPGASAEFKFQGPTISIIYGRQTNGGSFTITIDDSILLDTIDSLSTSEVGEQLVTYSDLGDGPHKVTVQAVGQPNAAINDHFCVLDGFIVGGPAAQMVDDQSGQLAWTGPWMPYKFRNGLSGTVSFSKNQGAKASFTFSGTSISWVYAKQQNAGIAQVSIDGVPVDSVDQYSPISLGYQVNTYSGLVEGTHVISIEVSGRRNPSASDTYVIVDAFMSDIAALSSSIQDNSDAVSVGSWQKVQTKSCYGGTESVSTESGSSLSFNFEGSWATILFAMRPNAGIVQVIIDDVVNTTLDLYSPLELTQQAFTWNNLGSGQHSIRVLFTGTANPRSLNRMVNVDGFIAGASKTRVPSIDGQVVAVAHQIDSLATAATTNDAAIAELRSAVAAIAERLSAMTASLAGISPVIPTFVDSEIPSGVINGINVSFSLTAAPSPSESLKVYKNGLLLKKDADYTVDGSAILFLSSAIPQAADQLMVSYRK
jgi:hypothetical protein